MSKSGALKLKLPNGEFVDGLGLSADGDVHIMCTDGTYRQVHPAIVEALATNMVPSGIWLTAYMRRQTNDADFKKMGALMNLDPTA